MRPDTRTVSIESVQQHVAAHPTLPESLDAPFLQKCSQGTPPNGALALLARG